MIKTTLLTFDELERIGSSTATDTTFILGGIQTATFFDQYGKYRTCIASSSLTQEGQVKILTGYGHWGDSPVTSRNMAIRPALQKKPPLFIQEKNPQEKFLIIDNQKIPLLRDMWGASVFEFGAYPTSAVTPELSQTLETLWQNNSLIPTRHFYTTDAVALDNEDGKFQPRENLEYEYEGERYVRLKVQNTGMFFLSTGERVENRPSIWTKVEPIRWVYNANFPYVYTENALFAGIKWNENGRSTRYSKSFIARYLSDIFDHEIRQSHDFCYAKSMASRITTSVASRVVEIISKDKTRSEQRQMLPHLSSPEKTALITQLTTPTPMRTADAIQGFALHAAHVKAYQNHQTAEDALKNLQQTDDQDPTTLKNAKRRVIRAQKRVEQTGRMCQDYLVHKRGD